MTNVFHKATEKLYTNRVNKVFFVLSTGRCGTRYMANLLNLAGNATVLHEPEPGCETINPIACAFFFSDIKRFNLMRVHNFDLLYRHTNIYKQIDTEVFGDCYNSIYPFAIPLYYFFKEKGIQAKFIHLVRNPIDCCSSILRSEGPNGVGIRKNYGLRAKVFVNSIDPSINAVNIWIKINQIISYSLQKIEKMAHGCTRMIRIEDMNDYDNIIKLYKFLSLNIPDKADIHRIMTDKSDAVRHSHQKRLDNQNVPKITDDEFNTIVKISKHAKKEPFYYDIQTIGYDMPASFKKPLKHKPRIILIQAASPSDLNKLHAPAEIKSSREMEQDGEKTLSESFRVHYPDTSNLTVNIGLPDKADQRDKTRESAKVGISVIIPTFNRAEFLAQTIESVLNQTIPQSEYEIIIVDNNSSDNTKFVIENLNRKHGNRIRYVFEPESGLVYGRHAGAREAMGEILVFADDDIIVSEGWLVAIKDSFSDPGVALVGGKITPSWEGAPPSWIADFWTKGEYGSWMMHLSLIDLGDELIEVPANFVFGCNFSIRKRVLFECGGFHPDSYPLEMIRWRGDGEYGLALTLMKKGFKTVYNPAAHVKHVVPRGRMAAEYFCRRAFAEGVSNSYTQIREKGFSPDSTTLDADAVNDATQFALALIKGSLKTNATTLREIRELIAYSYKQGKLYHQYEASNDPVLLSHILRKDYYRADPLPANRNKPPKKSHDASHTPSSLLDEKLTSEAIISRQAISFATEGRGFLGECFYLKALASFDNAMYLNPDMSALQYLRAVALLSVGRVREAEVALEAELKARPDFKPACSLKTSLHQARGLEKLLAVTTKLTFAERMFLHLAAKEIPDKGVIVEIGSHLGASACFLAEGARKRNGRVFCIDTWQNDAMPGERQDTHADFKKNTHDYSDIITPLRGFSVDVADGFSERIDLLFIDGDHSYEGCLSDIRNWIPKLKSGGRVVFHDYGWAKGVQRSVAECIRPIESAPGQRIDSMYYTTIKPSESSAAPFPVSAPVTESTGAIIQPFEKAISLINTNRSAEALKILDELASGEPSIPRLQLIRSVGLYKLDRLDEAESAIGKELLLGGRTNETINIVSQIQQKRVEILMRSIENRNAVDVSWVKKTPMTQTSAVIYITELCNSRCITCNAWKNKKEDQLSTVAWVDILRQIRQTGVSSVEFVGGEPLLRRDLPELASEAKRLGFSTILVSSNGFLLDRNHINNLIQHGVNSFHISIDGMRDIYKFVRGVDWFDKVVNAVQVISERKIPLLILTTLVRQNIAELETIVSMAERYGFLWFANILENMKFLFKGIDINNIQIIESDDIVRVLETLNKIRAAHPRTCILREEDVKYIKDYLEDTNRESRVPCPLGFNEIYFDARGNVYPGCMSLQPAGNAIQTPLLKIIDSSTMRSRLKAMLLRKCPGCTCGYPRRAQLMHRRPE